MTEHEHEFKRYRDGRPDRCKCGAWVRVVKEVVTDEPLPPANFGRRK